MSEALLYPVLAQIALTFALLFTTAGLRFSAVSSGTVKVQDIVLGQKAWPEKVQQYSNAFQNQLETPILFYAGVLFAMVLNAAGPILMMLAWTWFGLRVVHAGIHITSNNLQVRFMAFGASVIALLAFWVVLAVEVVSR
ncbi:MAG: MAPEG family protein [Alphaproteobacteria bacterium]|uniref:MAPEG family protein n=1 Tax=Maricaulis alexandrii TaxID=2570354 RepID=UPI0011099B66|nr:MAPEG family protein [Maricaulis alexandrii]MCR9266596.1 MAPEG family protein [Alphaproteobacteria bacterium]